MALQIDTFSNQSGGHSFFKAIGHPLAAEKVTKLLGRLSTAGPIALYDPQGLADPFAEIYPLGALNLAGVFVQNILKVGQSSLGHTTQPVTDLPTSGAKIVFIIGFDADTASRQIGHLFPDGAEVVSLEEIKLPEALQTVSENYLDPLNFATNFAFFRDSDTRHTRIVTANYWARYGASDIRLWARLLDGGGQTLAEWTEDIANGNASIVIDSHDIRQRFNLGDFSGQLFLHFTGVKGHDVVKYALDLYGDDAETLSCTHDANPWPADRYAGLPAPAPGETVTLWIQNSHPCPIPARGIGLNKMGDEAVTWLDRDIPPFASYALDVTWLLPDLAYPDQIEIQAGKYFVRPRYEITNSAGRHRIAHANVERTDLKPDPQIRDLSNMLGKGYVLPAPILPPERFESSVLPTPMSTSQMNLPVAVKLYDANGQQMHTHKFGCLARDASVWMSLDTILEATGSLPSGFGHMELVYDFADGGEADGWLHAIFRYRDRQSDHAAETSFGAHIFNSPLTYKNEPQSYTGPPPGLTTRLFLRLGDAPLDTRCHLIYTAATEWHPHSATDLILHNALGQEVARERVEIPCNGSYLWRYTDIFSAQTRQKTGDQAYIIIQDTSCRLFGYHGLLNGQSSFSLDHMFGF